MAIKYQEDLSKLVSSISICQMVMQSRNGKARHAMEMVANDHKISADET